MRPSFVTNHLDIWTSAIEKKSASGRGSNGKIGFYGIKKLRELILELAVRGKLVPQDPNDEPASVLLERIAAEKEKLIKEKKIKKPKKLPEIADDEKPFELPNGWEWRRLEAVTFKITDGEHLSPKKTDNGVMLLTAKHVQESGVSTLDPQYVSKEDAEKFRLKCDPTIGDILVCSRGTIGRSCVISISDYFCLMGSVILLRAPEDILPDYLNSFIRNPIGQLFIRGITKGMAVNALYLKDIKFAPVPIPPLAEQHRIVAKIDELMSLCDQLEQQTEDSIAAHQSLVEKLLNTLTQSQNAEEIAQNWNRISNHFDTLFTTEHSIDQLKQTILQLAVMGKLVPQDPNDEPASVLLEKIAAEKEILINEGKIKKQKLLPEISEDEKPFDLPGGWEWERIGVFSLVGTGATPSRTNIEYYQPAEINWVTSGETNQKFITQTKEKISRKAISETNVSIYAIGTLIVAMYGQGKTRGQITELLIEAGTNQACAAIQLIEKHVSHRKYIRLFFEKAYDELRSHAAGGAQPNLNVGKISTTVIPIPPIEEQKRIVAKVDELMSNCEKLGKKLSDAEIIQKNLTSAITEQAVG